MRRARALLIVALTACAAGAGCSAPVAPVAPVAPESACVALTLQRPAFGVLFDYEVEAGSEVAAKDALEAAAREVARIQSLLSSWRADSQLAEVNRGAATAPVAVDPLLFDAIDLAVAMHERTGGAFDPTIGPLMAAWGWRPRGEVRVPSAAELEAALAVVGPKHVVLDRARRTVRFDRKGVDLDLDGIAKGIAVDRAICVLRQHGVKSAMVSAGESSIACIGGPRRIALTGPALSTMGAIDIMNESISTSGNWQREQTKDGTKIGHLLDPRTGRPVENDVVSVSVVAKTATESDAWDTAIVVGGESVARAARSRGLRVVTLRARD